MMTIHCIFTLRRQLQSGAFDKSAIRMREKVQGRQTHMYSDVTRIRKGTGSIGSYVQWCNKNHSYGPVVS